MSMHPTRLPAPGTTWGPCETPCTHPQCNEIKTTAEKICLYCNQPIGYVVSFYYTDNGAVHQSCLFEHVEQLR